MRRFDHVTLAVPEQLGPGPHRCQATQVVQADTTTGWALAWRFGPGDDGDDEPVVFETHDGGRSWTELPPLCPRTTWLTKLAILGLVLVGSAPGLVDPLASLLVPGLHAPSPADPWLAQGLACLAVILLLALAVTIRWRRALGVWPTGVERLLGHSSPGHVVAVVRAYEQSDLHELLWDGWRWRYLQSHGARPALALDDEPA